jgi:thiamine biosynthesis lipoprotein
MLFFLRPFFAFVVAALLVGCSSETPQKEPVLVLNGQTMGTTYTVKLVGEVGETVQRELSELVEERLESVNQRMSTYVDDSELMRWNRAPAEAPVKVSPELYEVMQAAVDVGQRSGGAYDITIGPVINAWGFGPEGFETDGVDHGQIEALLQRVGLEKLIFDPAASVVTRLRDDLEVDLSSIAKGYAVDRVLEALEEKGFTRIWVEVGGEVRAAGTNAEGRSWRVGIERPDQAPGTVERLISLDNQAMATSGDYRNYYEIEGVRYSHIIDPRDGWPIRHRLASVSVVHPRCMVADAFATALLVLGPEEGFALAREEGLAAYFLVREDWGFKELATEEFRRLSGMN